MLNADGSQADELARLEAALDRIAGAPRPHAAAPGGTVDPAIDTGAIAERLDALIAQMRDALAVEA